MSISYYVDRPSPKERSNKVVVLMLINATFAMIMLAPWSVVSRVVAEPIAWATWARVYKTGDPFDMFDYPFVLLWLLPFGAVAAGWICEKATMRWLTYAWLTLPIVMHSLIFGWYYLAPPGWR